MSRTLFYLCPACGKFIAVAKVRSSPGKAAVLSYVQHTKSLHYTEPDMKDICDMSGKAVAEGTKRTP